MRRRSCLSCALLLLLPITLAAETRQVGTRTAARYSSHARSPVQPVGHWQSVGDGCASCGVTPSRPVGGGCGVPYEPSCGACDVCGVGPCCCFTPLRNIAIGIGRALDSLFTCGCGCGGCGGCEPVCAAPHGCCLPGLVSARFHSGGCGAPAGCTSPGCTGCGADGPSHGPHYPAAPMATDPFLDDEIQSPAPRAAAPRETRARTMTSPHAARSVANRPTLLSASRSAPSSTAPPRPSMMRPQPVPQRASAKAVALKPVKSASPQPSRSTGATKSVLMRTSAENEVQEPTPANPLRRPVGN